MNRLVIKLQKDSERENYGSDYLPRVKQEIKQLVSDWKKRLIT